MCAFNINMCSFGDFQPRKAPSFGSPSNYSEKKVHPPVPKLSFESLKKDENCSQHSARPRPKAKQTSSRAPNPRFSRPHTARTSTMSPIIPNTPISPREAKEKYSSMLTSYELKEIDNFDEIYYLGITSKKIRPKGVAGTDNYGFDDREHHYKAIIGDHLAYRFEIRAIFGKGAFGQVLRCYDHKTKTQVALKIVINTKQMHEQGKIEVMILQHLNNKDPDHQSDIVRGLDSFIFRNHVCATTEILGQNLYEYSRSIRFQPMSIKQIKSIAKHMLTALAFCHKNGVVHCDMKPENVLLLPNSSMNCRVIDFGSSCFKGHQKYEYIQSRFYRAPEVILGITYGPPMDIWSFACIVIEMMIGRPIFPGENEQEQLEMIMEVLGAPPRNLLSIAKRKMEFFTADAKPLLRNRRKKLRIPGSSNLRAATKFSDPVFLDLLQKCLEWDQLKRITADEALKHPWFTVVKTVKSSRSNSARPSSKNLPGLSNSRMRFRK